MSDQTIEYDVEFRAITKRFGSLVAVNGVSLKVRKGEFLSLLGPSGCGKTTSLRMIAGFEQPDEGELLIGGSDAVGIPPYRRDVNTVFQQYALFPHMSILDNVCYGLKQRKVSRRERRAKAGEALELVQLTGRDSHRPAMLSGGQQQRVALARALVLNPRVLLLDEPLGALDAKLRKALQIELKALQETVGITFVYVTHDQEEALTMSDRLAVMTGGRVEQVGSPSEVYTEPATAYVADFLGSANVIDVDVVGPVTGGTAFRLCEQVLVAGGRPHAAGPGKLVARPERLSLAPLVGSPATGSSGSSGSSSGTGSGSASVQVLPGLVDRSVYLGASVHVVVRLANGSTVTVGTSGHEPGTGYRHGDAVQVSLPAAALRLLPNGGQPD